MSKREAFNAIINKLKHAGLRFAESAEEFSLSGTCSFSGSDDSRIRFDAFLTDSHFVIIAKSNVKAEDNIPKMAYLIAELNNRCLEGKFLLDLSTGEVRFLHAIDSDIVEAAEASWIYEAVLLPSAMILDAESRLREYAA